jgi:hypothetical protein
MRAWERHKSIGLEEIEDALTVEIGDYTNVVSKVKAVSEMDASVLVEPVI